MKVVITGAAGNLGRVLAPALVECGHEPVLVDFRQMDTPYEFVQGDVKDGEFIKKVTRGADAIVHGAALHGIHLSTYTPDEFWDLNMTGTHNIYQAAVGNGIKKVIFSSTMGVYGESVPPNEHRYVAVTEELALLPGDIYGLSKKLGENMAEYYYRKENIKTISLRLGMFVPEDFVQYGFRLLKGGVDDRDVAHAFILALENEMIGVDSFNIMSEVPFTREDEEALVFNPRQVIENYYPGAAALFEEKEIQVEDILAIWGNTYWPIDKAKQILGYNPQFNFEGYLKALNKNDQSYYPYAGLPWWGV